MDELRRRRLDRLVEDIEALMLEHKHPAHFGKVVIPIDSHTLTDKRRAARVAGERLGWRVHTHVVGGELHVLDRRGPAQSWFPEALDNDQ